MNKWCLSIISLFALSALSFAMVAEQGEPRHRDFIFEYDVTINDIPKDSSRVNVWIPCARETSYQQVKKVTESAPVASALTIDKKYNNRIKFYSIDVSDGMPVNISLRYIIRRYEYENKPGHLFEPFRPAAGAELKKFLLPSRLVTISPRIRKLAAAVTKGKKTDMEKARALYDYVFENLSYDKTVPGWGRGDSERACDVKKGNCTDFHSFFISLARASGIPARFIIGVPLPQREKGAKDSYHCWAEFYVDGAGWIPVDISEAWKDKSKHEYHFGTLDENRVEFTEGRDIILEGSHGTEPLNYFIFPHVEIDGKAAENADVIFRYENIS